MIYLGFKEKELKGIWNTDLVDKEIIPKDKIKITKELSIQVTNMGSLKFKEIPTDLEKEYSTDDFDTLFENYIVNIPKEPTSQDKLNANLIKQNADLLIEVKTQKELNSQILLELAKLKGGNTNV